VYHKHSQEKNGLSNKVLEWEKRYNDEKSRFNRVIEERNHIKADIDREVGDLEGLYLNSKNDNLSLKIIIEDMKSSYENDIHVLKDNYDQ
jgi:hypothetical protein